MIPTSLSPSTNPGIQQGWQQNGVTLLVLDIPMVPGINKKTRKTATSVYTSAEYRKLERLCAEAISRQVQAAGWSVSKDDRYLVELHTPFTSELLADLDGIIKPILDAMQQMEPSLQELRQMVDPDKIAAWQSLQPVTLTKTGKIKTVRPTTYREWKKLVDERRYTAWLHDHPPALKNDSQVVDVEPIKYVKLPAETLARIFLYRLSAQQWREIAPWYARHMHTSRAAALAI